MRTPIKICGVTRPEDAETAARLGADAVGLVFAADSPRRLTIEQARNIAAALPPFVTRVGVFQDASKNEIDEVLNGLHLDLLQFHGTEPAAFCSAWRRPWLKAVPMRGDIDARAYMAGYPDAGGFLLDAYERGEAGGKGRRFDWSRIPHDLPAPLILAGGLNPDNVFQAICHVSPFAVDVSSGVESAPGVKAADLMARFIEEVRRAERETS